MSSQIYKICFNIGFNNKGCSITETEIPYNVVSETEKTMTISNPENSNNRRINKNTVNTIIRNDRIHLSNMICYFSYVDSKDLIEDTKLQMKEIALKHALTLRGEIASASRLQVNQLSEMISNLNTLKN